VLFGSILSYSLATIANAWVQGTFGYSVCRFVAGLGLAGELGAGVTLVSELLPARSRGYGTMIVAAVGVVGVCVASLVGDRLDWRHAYLVGGGLGLLLLGLRFGVRESTLFEAARVSTALRGNLKLLFSNRRRVGRYLAITLVALPIWCAISVFVTFSPELGKALGLTVAPSAGRAVLFYYIGLTFGDLCSGYLSQRLGSRRRAIAIFMGLFAACVGTYPLLGAQSLALYYTSILLLGFASGFWATFITMSAELFGTNLRATVATSAPNLVRGLAVPLTWIFKNYSSTLGKVGTAMALGVGVLVIAVVALRFLRETFGCPLDYLEE
jgi:MFS family permease